MTTLLTRIQTPNYQRYVDALSNAASAPDFMGSRRTFQNALQSYQRSFAPMSQSQQQARPMTAPTYTNPAPIRTSAPARRSVRQGGGGGGGMLADLLRRAERARANAYQDYLRKLAVEQEPEISKYQKQMAEREATAQQNEALFESRYGQLPYSARQQYVQAYTTKPPEKTWQDPKSIEQFGAVKSFVDPSLAKFLSDSEWRELTRMR